MNSTTITFPDEKRFCFLGSGDVIKMFIEDFQTQNTAGNHVTVITNEDADRNWSFQSSEDIGNLSSRLGVNVRFVEMKDIDRMVEIVSEDRLNIGLVLGWRAVFPARFLDLFNGCLFNYHPSKLPRYRGAGGFSWQVLNGEPEISVSIHQMTPGLDQGEILLQEGRPIDHEAPNPSDYFSATSAFCRQILFPKLSGLLLDASRVDLVEQDEENAEYFPLLFTPENGLLNFAWNVEEIETFVRAFSYPYPGASVRYLDRILRVRKCEIVHRTGNVHPFCHGLITNVPDTGVHVLVRGGLISFTEIRDIEGGSVPYSEFRVGNRFYNTPDDLMQAKLYRHRM